VGVALGAGGARGFAHIGVLRFLEERGIVPDAITGTSMGALVGAGIASGLDTHEAEAKMQEFLRSRVKSLLRPALPFRSFFSGRGVDNVCRWLYGNTTFRDLRTPMSIIATDLVSGRGIALREGSVAKAVRASISIPGMFPPLVVGPYVFVDGGVCEPVPTAALKALGADITIAVNISVTAEDLARWAADEGGASKRPIREGVTPNILDTYSSSINIAVSDRAMGGSRAADIAIRPRFRVAGWREFQQGPEHFRRGYAAASESDELLAKHITWYRGLRES
jgi:NTE family protein